MVKLPIPGKMRFLSVSTPATPGPEFRRSTFASSSAACPLAAHRRSWRSYFFSLAVGACSGGGVVVLSTMVSCNSKQEAEILSSKAELRVVGNGLLARAEPNGFYNSPHQTLSFFFLRPLLSTFERVCYPLAPTIIRNCISTAALVSDPLLTYHTLLRMLHPQIVTAYSRLSR